MVAPLAPPEGDAFGTDQHYDEDCVFVDGGSVLNSPHTALLGYYSYEGCVQMTERVFVLRLASGRILKLQVLGYYPPEIQAMCQAIAQTPMPSRAANMTTRWMFLD